MAHELIQFRLQVWYLDGRKEVSFFFRCPQVMVRNKVEDLLTSHHFKGGISSYILYQI